MGLYYWNVILYNIIRVVRRIIFVSIIDKTVNNEHKIREKIQNKSLILASWYV